MVCVQPKIPSACISGNADDGFAHCDLTQQATLTMDTQLINGGFSSTGMQVSPGISGTAAMASVSLEKVGVYAPSCEKLNSKSTLAGACSHALQNRTRLVHCCGAAYKLVLMMQNKRCCEHPRDLTDLHTKQTKIWQHPQHC